MKAIKMLMVLTPEAAKSIGPLALDYALEFHSKEIDWPPVPPTEPLAPAITVSPVNEPILVKEIPVISEPYKQLLKQAAAREPAKWLTVVGPDIIAYIKMCKVRPVHYSQLAHVVVARGYKASSVTPICSYCKRNNILLRPKRGFYDVPDLDAAEKHITQHAKVLA